MIVGAGELCLYNSTRAQNDNIKFLGANRAPHQTISASRLPERSIQEEAPVFSLECYDDLGQVAGGRLRRNIFFAPNRVVSKSVRSLARYNWSSCLDKLGVGSPTVMILSSDLVSVNAARTRTCCRNDQSARARRWISIVVTSNGAKER